MTDGMRFRCELCGYLTKPSNHYSVRNCNDTGLGVSMHKRCALAVEYAMEFGGDGAAEAILRRLRGVER